MTVGIFLEGGLILDTPHLIGIKSDYFPGAALAETASCEHRIFLVYISAIR